jgi:hypothetical protein
MTTADTTTPATDAAPRQRKLPFIIAVSSAGTLIEFYDFYLKREPHQVQIWNEVAAPGRSISGTLL